MGSIKHYIAVDKKITKNKAFEFELGKDTDWDMYDVFQINFQWLWKADHAGPRFRLSIARWHLGVSIYDIRHWDYEKNNYENKGFKNENNSLCR